MKQLSKEEVQIFNKCNPNKLTQLSDYIVNYSGCQDSDYKGNISEKWYYQKQIYTIINDGVAPKIISNFKKGKIKQIDGFKLFDSRYEMTNTKDEITDDDLYIVSKLTNTEIITLNKYE